MVSDADAAFKSLSDVNVHFVTRINRVIVLPFREEFRPGAEVLDFVKDIISIILVSDGPVWNLSLVVFGTVSPVAVLDK